MRFLVAVSLLAGLVVVVVLPPRFTAHRHFDKTSDELKAQNDVRTTLLQALAGTLLATGAYLTFRQLQHNIQSSHEEHELDRQQQDLDRQGQITDRYTKAVDQLGSEHLDVRVTGIYALERIARDSPQDRATIEKVLTAYVRGHAPWPPPPAAPTPEVSTQQPTTAATPQPLATASPAAGTNGAGQPDKKVAESQGPTADVHAAMTVLGRRQLPPAAVGGSTSPGSISGARGSGTPTFRARASSKWLQVVVCFFGQVVESAVQVEAVRRTSRWRSQPVVWRPTESALEKADRWLILTAVVGHRSGTVSEWTRSRLRACYCDTGRLTTLSGWSPCTPIRACRATSASTGSHGRASAASRCSSTSYAFGSRRASARGRRSTNGPAAGWARSG